MSRWERVEGDTKEERHKNWYNHFSSPLGNPPDIDDNKETMEQNLEPRYL